jgi:pimeloyl-ACP methyl ester carboxylesterase
MEASIQRIPLALALFMTSATHSAMGARQDEHAQPAHAAATTVASKDGTRIAYERAGHGPALVIVSAALSDRTDTARLGALLAPKFTVIQYDRRGRGASGDTPPYAAQREIEDLEALIDVAGGTAFLFGSSSGAVLALEAASKLGAKVPKLVVFEPPFVVDASRPPVPADLPARIGELVASGRRGDAVAAFMSDGVGLPATIVAEMRKAPSWPRIESLAHTLVYDLTVMGDTQAGKPLPRERWESTTATTLVLDGGASQPWLHEAARSLGTLLPHAERFTLDGQDHSVATTAPQALAPVLVDFLGG